MRGTLERIEVVGVHALFIRGSNSLANGIVQNINVGRLHALLIGG